MEGHRPNLPAAMQKELLLAVQPVLPEEQELPLLLAELVQHH